MNYEIEGLAKLVRSKGVKSVGTGMYSPRSYWCYKDADAVVFLGVSFAVLRRDGKWEMFYFHPGRIPCEEAFIELHDMEVSWEFAELKVEALSTFARELGKTTKELYYSSCCQKVWHDE